MGDTKKLKNNLLILYLLEKIELPLPMSHIEVVALEHMDYFALNDAILDLTEINYIESSKANNEETRYSITGEGGQSIEYFDKHLSAEIRNKVNQYVLANRKNIKRDYQTTANFFQNLNSDDYTVKCALYEDDTMLVEINLNVVSSTQAKIVCNNWRKNTTKVYGAILDSLTGADLPTKKTEQ